MLNPNFIGLVLAALLIFSFWIYVFIIFYHLVRFGVGRQPKVIAALFMLGALVLFFINVTLFAGIDWAVFAQGINIQL